MCGEGGGGGGGGCTCFASSLFPNQLKGHESEAVLMCRQSKPCTCNILSLLQV